VTFAGDFNRYLKSRTDCPPDFHVHAALCALAVALGNRVWTHGRSQPIYPNLWSVVIAPSGYGKSVPLDMATTVLQQAGLGQHLLPNSFSQEALYPLIQAEPVGAFVVQEFAAFLGTLNRDYNAGVMSWLTSVFDVPPEDRRVLRKETFLLVKPTVTILGASSPTWFAESYRQSMLSGGFLARFLFCPSRDPGPYVEDPGPRDDGVEAGLADHLRRARELGGVVDMSGVMRGFNDWERGARATLRKDCPEEFSGMRSRAGTMVKKAAMLFMASRNPETRTVTQKDLDNAVAYVERSHTLAEKFLGDEVARDRDDADRLRLIEIVRRYEGRAMWSRALKDSHMSADKFRRAVDTLVASERVRLERGEGKTQWLVESTPLRVLNGVA
jgi:hypothetical protein